MVGLRMEVSLSAFRIYFYVAYWCGAKQDRLGTAPASKGLRCPRVSPDLGFRVQGLGRIEKFKPSLSALLSQPLSYKFHAAATWPHIPIRLLTLYLGST